MSKKIKLVSGTLLCAILVFFAGWWTGRRPIPKKEIQVVEKKVGKTKWKYPKLKTAPYSIENYAKLQSWHNTPLQIFGRTVDDNLFVTASDSIKTTKARFSIRCGSSGNWKLYLGVGLGAVAVGGFTYAILKLK